MSDKKYSSHFEWAKNELRTLEGKKQATIRELAQRLDHGGMPAEKITAEITKQLEGYASSRYIRECLDDKFKQRSKIRKHAKVCGVSSAKSQQLEMLSPSDGSGMGEPLPDNDDAGRDNGAAGSTDTLTGSGENELHSECAGCKEKEIVIGELRSERRQPYKGIIPKDMLDEVIQQAQNSDEHCFVYFDRHGVLIEAEADQAGHDE